MHWQSPADTPLAKYTLSDWKIELGGSSWPIRLHFEELMADIPRCETFAFSIHPAESQMNSLFNRNMSKLQSLAISLKSAEMKNNKELEGQLHKEIGDHCYSVANYGDAIEHFQAYLAISEETADQQGKKEACKSIGTCFYFLGEYIKAVEYYLKHLAIAKGTGDKEGEGTAYGNLGACYDFLGRHDEAIKYDEMCLNVAKEERSKQREGAVYWVGSCCRLLHKFDKAVKHEEMRLATATEIGDKGSAATAYGNLGAFSCLLGQYEKAIQYLQMSLDIAEETTNDENKGSVYYNLGLCYHWLGQCDKAVNYQELSLEIARNAGDKLGQVAACSNLGAHYCDLRQFKKVIYYQEMILAIAKEVGQKDSEGRVYGNLGKCFQHLFQYDKAVRCFERHLAIAKDVGDKKREALACNSIGACHYYLGRYEKAIEYHKRSLALAKEFGYKDSEGSAFGNIGNSYTRLGQHDRAVQNYEMCLTVAKQTRNKEKESIIYSNLGTCFRSLSQYDKAIEFGEKCLNIATEIGDKEGEGSAYGELGACYYHLGLYRKAIEYQEMRLTIANEMQNKKEQIIACSDLGTSYYSLGQYGKAIRYERISLVVAQEIGDRLMEGTSYGKLGTCYLRLGQYANKALKYLKRSLAVAVEFKEGIAAAFQNLGVCYCSLGQPQRAVWYHKRSLTISKGTGDKRIEGSAYCSLGVCFHSLGHYEKAIQCLELSLDIAKSIGKRLDQAIAYGKLGDCYISLGQFNKAENNLLKGVECFEKLFEDAPKIDEDKVSFLDTFIRIIHVLTGVLLAQEKRGQALITAERGRARALLHLMLARTPARDFHKMSDLNEIRKVVKVLGRTVLYYALPTSFSCTWIIQPVGKVMYHQHRVRLSEQYREMDGMKNYLSSLVNKVLELMKSCGPVNCEDRSLSFLHPEESSRDTNLTKQDVDLSSSKDERSLSGASLNAAVDNGDRTSPARGTANTLLKPVDLRKASLNSLLQDLYQIVLEPIRSTLKETEVIVVPEGPLALAPFGALVDESGRYVAESLRVSLVPSLVTAELIHECPEDLRQVKPLVIGDPDVGVIKTDGESIRVPRLKFAKKEVEVVGHFLRVEPLVGKDATKKKFLEEAGSASIIHIAAHGDAEKGEILFARRPGTEQSNCKDIMLTVSDLEYERIKAKLVVLSCCYSGRGKVRGEGVVGIARAFLGAGARAVLVTLWAVDDGATLLFMFRFYEYLASGDRASEALHKAMNAIRTIEKFSHPRYWAPFVLLGEDVTLFKKSEI